MYEQFVTARIKNGFMGWHLAHVGNPSKANEGHLVYVDINSLHHHLGTSYYRCRIVVGDYETYIPKQYLEFTIKEYAK